MLWEGVNLVSVIPDQGRVAMSMGGVQGKEEGQTGRLGGERRGAEEERGK